MALADELGAVARTHSRRTSADLSRCATFLVAHPAHSPNRSPHAERLVRTIRTECLDPFVIFGERHLRYLVKQFVEHYSTERFHQGLGGQLIRQPAGCANDNGATGTITCRSRLGGLLNLYHREAA